MVEDAKNPDEKKKKDAKDPDEKDKSVPKDSTATKVTSSSKQTLKRKKSITTEDMFLDDFPTLED